MSCLDYLDYDVSNLLGQHVQDLREKTQKYNNVINQLQYMIDFNIHIQYLRKFTKFKKRYIPYHIGSRYKNLWDDKKLVEGTIEFLNKPTRTNYVHGWPAKKPIYSSLDSYSEVDIDFIRTNKFKKTNEDGTPWSYYSYPLDINLNSLPSMCKALQNLK